MKTFRLLSLPLFALAAALPGAAAAFDAVDTQIYPSSGFFPAYPASGTAALPFQLWGQAGIMSDNNIFRRSANEESEQIARFGAGVRNDIRVYGRQTIRLQAEANAYVYNNFSDLDHVAYGLLGEWRWELGNDLSGTVGYTRRKFQADLAEVARGVRDLITDNRFYANGQWRLGPSVRLRAGADYAVIERPLRTIAELRTAGATFGADYVSGLNNTLGVEARVAHGDAPVPETVAGVGLVNNSSNFSEVAAVAAYNAGAQLRFSGRVGRSRITYSDLPSRDFSGGSARGRVEWLPGTKTVLSFEAYHEPRTIIDVAATHALVKGAALGANWAPTAKLTFSTRLLHENRDFEGDPATAAPGGVVRKDTLRAWRLGSGWEVTRHVNIGVALDRGVRDSSALARDYQFTAVMANVRYNY